MTISKDLFLSILAMDAYNRGYNAGISDGEGLLDINGIDVDGLGGAGSQIGSATVVRQSDTEEGSDGVTAGFYALSYSIDETGPEDLAGKTVISSQRVVTY